MVSYNEIPDESEQWLLDSRCDVCRREKYCHKICKRAEVNKARDFANKFAKELSPFIVNTLKKLGENK